MQEKGRGVAEVPQGQPEEMVELEATLPPMEEICVTNVHMMKHIPSRLRKRCGDILKAIFWKIAQNDSTSNRG